MRTVKFAVLAHRAREKQPESRRKRRAVGSVAPRLYARQECEREEASRIAVPFAVKREDNVGKVEKGKRDGAARLSRLWAIVRSRRHLERKEEEREVGKRRESELKAWPEPKRDEEHGRRFAAVTLKAKEKRG
ncbi:hypothetical protein AMTR_s00073p00051040 [Amborella trichopoda]|uniref:Uncharacterized protein n=1 Tax=Amborella trichopoda TaxID=13333 RepID=W1NNG6_AMBTC|nr:hypothetical protein AMTR_s00073p00051040 [Amborella trichopoda]